MKNWKKLLALGMVFVMVLAMAACGNKAEEKPAEEPEEEAEDYDGPELPEDLMDDLYDQAAKKDLQPRVADYMPDEIVGHAETFHITREGDKGRWYVYLGEGEYVEFDGKAYNITGSYGEAIIEFDYTQDGPKLTDVIWSEDGEGHEKWIEENFTDEARKNLETFNKDEKNRDLLIEIVEKKAEDALGVPVEKELLFQIDEAAGTYTLLKPIESGEGEDYKFDTETITSGKLDELKK